MAAPNGTYITTSAIGLREDLTEIFSIVEQEQTPLQSMIAKKTKASATTHEWQTQALAAASSTNYAYEGGDPDNKTVTASARIKNICQIQQETYQVSGTMEAVNKAGRKSELGLQRDLAMRELKRTMEKTFFLNQASSASDPRKLGGLPTWLTTNVSRGSGGSNGGFNGSVTTVATDGTQRAFTESLLKSVLVLGADSGAVFDTITMGAFNKQSFSAFTGNASKFKDVDDRRLVATVDVYQGDFGRLKAVFSPQQRTRDVFLLDSRKIAIASLRPVRMQPLAKTGDSYREQIIGEHTLVVENQKAHGGVFDCTTS